MTDVATALAHAADVGPYFELTTGRLADESGFRPLVELYDVDRPTALAERIEDVRRRLGTAEPRVAASILFLGLASRLWSPVLGAAVIDEVVPDLDPRRVRWRYPATGPVELWASNPVAREAGADRVGDLYDAVMSAHLVPLAEATRAVVPVAEALLWGNAASALVGAAGVLHRRFAVARPEPAASARDIAAGLLRTGLLRGTASGGGGAFRRTTCCLYYRVPRGGVCGDCVFDAPPRRRRAG
ncbi:(2Fe-2S)-binding protein [Streptomyces sp. SID3343]|uniref:(2Fe-2S)-binding protein n=1 Tax=Streptomyces sp. SID3343 TaxID=2690260 RepID=UPI00136A7574|nr:(2Fe-2S)-binding protein [Streptomyces sp. SID3343]MYW03172.1 ferric iron reductase [Streptomyces sp. SID3343]